MKSKCICLPLINSKSSNLITGFQDSRLTEKCKIEESYNKITIFEGNVLQLLIVLPDSAFRLSTTTCEYNALIIEEVERFQIMVWHLAEAEGI